MAQWRKVIVSGSSAVLNQISASGAIVPKADNGSDLGSSTLEWKDLYIDGTANIDTLSADALGANLDHANFNSTNVDIDSGAIDNTVIGGATPAAGTFTAVEATTGNISGSLTSTGSFGKVEATTFTGDGSGLTGVAQDIDLLDSYGAATLHQTQDEFLLSDNGTEKRISFSNLQDSVFADITGDVLIAAGGASTIQANSVALGTDTTGNYVLDVTVGTGLGGAVASEGGTAALSLDAGQTVFTSIYNTSLIVGSAASQEYITFGTSNEVNTFINNSEVHSVTSAGVDITGALTISGDLTVSGDQTIISTTNLAITDKFAIFASGSTSATDGGIIVSKQADGAGFALGYDTGTSRWVLDNNLAVAATNIVPDAYMGVVEVGTGDGDSQAVPVYGGTTNGVGTIYVDTDDNEIWIYA